MNHALRRLRPQTAIAALICFAAFIGHADSDESSSSPANASPNKHWYDVLVSSPFESSGFREYIGASPLGEAEIAKAMSGAAPLALSDRRSFDVKSRTWTEYARVKPLLTDREFLNPAHILAIYPLVGDPLVVHPPTEADNDRPAAPRLVEPASAPGKYWYDVVMSAKVNSAGVREFVGSSRIEESVLARQLFDGAPLMLDDSRFYHMQTGRWSDWASSRFPMTNRVYLNPKHILSIAPFTGDPLVQNSKLPIERDLGASDWREAPKRWTLQLPAEVTKVEVTFYSPGGKPASADAGPGGVLQVNAAMAIGFRAEQADRRTFHDYLKNIDFQTTVDAADPFVDVTPLIKPGANEFLYYHRSPTPMGVKLQIYGTEFQSIIKQLGGAVQPMAPGESMLSVDLKDTKITDADLACLAGQGQVAKLNLMRTRIGDAGLAHLADLRGLETLELGSTKITDGGVQRLAGLTALRRLHLGHTDVSDAGLPALKDLQHLEELWLSQTKVTGPGLAHLRGLPKLVRINLQFCNVDDQGLVALCELPHLQSLAVDSPRITDAGGTPLARLVAIQDLYLNGTSIGDAALAHLKTLPKLRSLQLAKTNVTDAGVRELAGLRNLIVLDLSNTKVTDAGLEPLQGLLQVGSLNLAGTRVTDAGLARLAGLSHMTALHLNGTAINGSGLAHLAKMEKLELLVLDQTPITDSALAHLSPLKSLRRLLVRGVSLSDPAIDALKQQLPELRVTGR